MQRCTCTVLLAGEVTQTVVKTGVSPAEILVLRAIHGEHAVVDVRSTTNDRGVAVNERERLARIYKKHYHEAFPGANNKLPERFDEIGIKVDIKPVPIKGKGPKGKRNAEPTGVESVTATDLADGEGEGEESDKPGADAPAQE